MGLFDFWKKSKGKETLPPETSASTVQAQEKPWDEAARDEFRLMLREVVLGEVRLYRSSPSAFLELCREVYIEDQAPENEWESLLRFANDEIKAAAAMHAQEQAQWPMVTDCDRLDQIEEALRKRGILLWQASPCCDTCSGSELPERIALVERRHPGFGASLRGYAFFIDQRRSFIDQRRSGVRSCFATSGDKMRGQRQDPHESGLTIAPPVSTGLTKLLPCSGLHSFPADPLLA